jgi:ATP-dependent helicase/nuclease subunit A
VGISDDGLRRLAGHLADSLMLPSPAACCATLDAQDAQMLAEARSSVARWLDLVDRLPPAEILDRVLDDAAYAYELRGPRLPQARENLKKIRALVRRLQNRGYLTMGRVAAYIDRLSVGDESNAVIDAVDAVNLMTVHASKGLEFPIVFVVNLAKGTGNWLDPIRVSSSGGDPQVSIGDFQSDADEESVPKDREETKRLLYVALTRARDRLYLSSVVKDGRFQAGRGSLGDVLPSSLTALFPAAMAGDAVLPWGDGHRIRVCATESDERQVSHTGTPIAAIDDFGPLADVSVPPARAVVASLDARPDIVAAARVTSDRLVGLLVHRMLQRYGFEANVEPLGGEALVRDLVRPDERAEIEEAIETTARAVVSAYLAACRRDDVREAIENGTILREVPFTLDRDGARLRGAIDCLVRSKDGKITVLEFKTGRARPEHQEQLEIYREAAGWLFPGAPIDARLVYLEREAVS